MEALKPGQWYRCSQCGGKTRFTVVVTKTIRYYHHQTVGGDMTPENEEVLQEVVNEVTCVYCGNGNNVQVMEGLNSAE